MRFLRIRLVDRQPWIQVFLRVRSLNGRMKEIKQGQFPLATYLARY